MSEELWRFRRAPRKMGATMDKRLEMLQAWEQVHTNTTRAYEILKEFGVNIDAPVSDTIWKAFDETTKLASLAVTGVPAGVNCPLSWYCWDNDMGKKGSRGGFVENCRPIRTLEDLLWLIDSEAGAAE